MKGSEIVKTQIVYKKSIMEQLARQSIYPVKTERNIFNPKLFVWMYENTEEFRSIFDGLRKKQK